jgi:hypothetical protein
MCCLSARWGCRPGDRSLLGTLLCVEIARLRNVGSFPSLPIYDSPEPKVFGMTSGSQSFLSGS